MRDAVVVKQQQRGILCSAHNTILEEKSRELSEAFKSAELSVDAFEGSCEGEEQLSESTHAKKTNMTKALGLAGVVKAANMAVKAASKVTRGSIFVLSMDAKAALQAEEDNLSCGSIEGALAA